MVAIIREADRQPISVVVQRAGALRYVGLRAPARCITCPARGNCSKQGRQSQASDGRRIRAGQDRYRPKLHTCVARDRSGSQRVICPVAPR
jgi:hypothetical protein